MTQAHDFGRVERWVEGNAALIAAGPNHGRKGSHRLDLDFDVLAFVGELVPAQSSASAGNVDQRSAL